MAANSKRNKNGGESLQISSRGFMGTSPMVIWGRELKSSVKLSVDQGASDKGEKARIPARGRG